MRKFILQNKVAIIAVALVMCLSASCVVMAQSDGTILDRIVMTYLNLKASEQGNVGEAEVGMNSMLIEDHFSYFRINDGMYTAKDITTTGALIINGETNLYGLTSGDGTLASTTSTTSGGTLTEAELLANYLLDVQSNVDTSFPLTLPATSTMTTLLPNAGNHREWLIYNASTTAAVAITITAGTGIDLIGVTANDDVIDGNEYSTLNCHRKANTDVVCRLTEEIHVD